MTIETSNFMKLNLRSRSSSRERPLTNLQITNSLIRTNSCNNKKLIDDINLINPSTSSSSGSYTSSSYTESDSNNNLLIYPKIDSNSEPRRLNATCIKYGELVVLGYNGGLKNSNQSRRKSKFVLNRRDLPNGVKPCSQHVLQTQQEADNLIQKNPNHSVTYTLSRNQTVVVQYTSDDKTDMFQIGRSSESAIDFIVLDTRVPNLKILNQNQQSTISRFSCRIVVEREYPYTARIYAAGFDATKRIFLGEKATKWTNEKGEMDGVTTNGVLIMHPTNGFIGNDSKSNEWMEVSVCGAVFSLSETRLTPMISRVQTNNPNKNNILRDGTLIDLCGATLLWRSIEGLQKTPTKHYLDMNLEYLNNLRPQCPVGLKTLVFQTESTPMPSMDTMSSSSSLNSPDRIPMVYLKCGHVHGNHEWGIKKDNDRECPLCRKVGPYVQLVMGVEPSLYTDTDFLNMNNLFKPYAFRPCGHMASEKTCKYWSRILVPQGTTQGLNSICPFCSITLCKEQPYVKLIFQEGV
ncbi:unnamed protein product [Brachionus calyciflorus]|uniref:Pellino n=1 Tax=Brachionus calyciflorus TaxID=104777 RepID=A0A814GLP1_9BILA|nr:unnamed protein product [Brachionus calyciflorus]